MSTAAERADGVGVDVAPSWLPTPRELDDLEMLLLGGYVPLRGFLGPADLASIARDGTLDDGRPWPVPVTLEVPDGVAAAATARGGLVLVDEEGAPVASVSVEETWPAGADSHGIAGPVTALGPLERGSHRGLRRHAAELRHAAPPGRTVLGVPLDRPLHRPQLEQIRACARDLDADVVLLPLTGACSPRGVDGPALVRSCLGVREQLGAAVVPVAVPLHRPPVDEGRMRVLGALVAAAHGATHVPGPLPPVAGLPAAVDLPEMVLDAATGTWGRPCEVPVERRGSPGAPEVDAVVRTLITRGERVPVELTPAPVLRELRRACGRVGAPGFTILFTGLSGSGKSTLARAAHAALLERFDRTVTLLDGDVVRRMLSSELGFSRAHRELNVRRIGYVAAEATRHGGIALCAPIAPYRALRAEVRDMVEEHGGFILVHVSTSLEVCERRDRKGLYAKARAGLLSEFTGISDPYEPPTDADLVVDAGRVAVDSAVESILAVAVSRGLLVS